MTLILSTYSKKEFCRLVKTTGLNIKIGPFNIKLTSNVPTFLDNFYFLYSDCVIVGDDQYIDFHICLKPPSIFRRWYRPQVNFFINEFRPFKPLPIDQTMAFFEWGLNWTIAQQALQYLIIHSAVVEKEGKAIILPGMPGAGKSTLCAALVHHGWRLLSDEQALISQDATEIVPHARPINLKNQSIEVIKEFCPDAKFGQVFAQTSKGDICHVKPPVSAIEQIAVNAQPFAIVFPSYEHGLDQTKLTTMAKGETLIELINHCFNYTILGLDGFKRLSTLVENSQCFSLSYSDLNSAISTLDELY